MAQVYGIPEAELQERLKEYEVLMSGEIMGQKKLIHDFSNGNRQKIGIIAAMLVNPEILITYFGDSHPGISVITTHFG